MSVLWAQKNGEIDEGCQVFATWFKGEEDPELIVPRILLGGLKPVVSPSGLLDVLLTLLADT